MTTPDHPVSPVFAGHVTIDTRHPEGQCRTCARLAVEAESNARADGQGWLSIDGNCAANATAWEES